MKSTRGTTDAETLLSSLSPKLDDKLLREDMAKADRVRETFLSYRDQLITSLKILDKYGEQGDEQAKGLSDEVTQLVMTIDRLEKGKDVTSEQLLEFMAKLRGVGTRIESMSKDEAEGGAKGPLGEELRRRKQDTLEDDKKQDERFEQLGKEIGQPVEGFIKQQGELIGAGGGGFIKTALATWLGPAAPLVKLVDDLVDIDGKVAKGYKASLDLGKKVLTATVNAPAKLIKSGGEWAQTNLDYLKGRAREQDVNEGRRDKRVLKLMKDQIDSMRDMRKKLTRMAGAASAAMATMLSGLGALLTKAIGGLGGMVMKGLAGLVSFLPGTAFLSKIAKMISEGAQRIFRRGGQSPSTARKSAKDFTRRSTGRFNPDGTPKPQPRGTNGRYIPHPKDAPVKRGTVMGKVGEALKKGRASVGTAAKGLGVAAKGLGAAGGAYGLYDGYQTIKANKGKGFTEGGVDSRAAGYGSSVLGGAAVGATIGSVIPVIGTVVGGVVGGAVGGLSALIADNEDEVKEALAGGWKKAQDYGTTVMTAASTLVKNFGPTMAAGPMGAAVLATATALGVNTDQIKEWSGAVGGWLKDTAKAISDSVGTALGKAVASIGDTVSAVVTGMGDWLRKIGLGDALDWGKEKADAVAKTYRETKEGAKEAVNQAWNSVSNWFDHETTTVQAKASAVAASVTGNVLNTATNVKDSVKASTGIDLAKILPESVRQQVRQTKAGANYEGVKGDILNASKETGMNAGTMARFAQIESGFNGNAQAKTSSAGGLYQFIDSTWQEQLAKHGAKYGFDKNTSKFNPRANALMGAEFLKGNKEQLSKVTGGEVNDTQLYMAHFLGAGGAGTFFKEMQKNPDARADQSMAKAAKANPTIFYKKDGTARTLKEVYEVMDRKVAATDSIAAKATADANGGSVATAQTSTAGAPAPATSTTPAGVPVAATGTAVPAAPTEGKVAQPAYTGAPGASAVVVPTATAPALPAVPPASTPKAIMPAASEVKTAKPVGQTGPVGMFPINSPNTVSNVPIPISYPNALGALAKTNGVFPKAVDAPRPTIGMNTGIMTPRGYVGSPLRPIVDRMKADDVTAPVAPAVSRAPVSKPAVVGTVGVTPMVKPAKAVQQGTSAAAAVTSAKASGIPGISTVPTATPVAQADVHYIPKSVTPPTVNAEASTPTANSNSGGASSGGMKSSLSQIPFVPGDQNLLAINITGLIG